MLRVFVRLLLVIAGFILALAVLGSLLPRDFSFRVERQFAAPPALIYQQVSDLSQWPNWTTWNSTANNSLSIELGPVQKGLGASQTWTDPRGSGKLWITKAEPDQEIEYLLRFGSFPEQTNQIGIVPLAEGSTVSWSCSGSLPGGPFYGYFRGFFVSGLKYEYERCLERLDQQLRRPEAAVKNQANPDPG